MSQNDAPFTVLGIRKEQRAAQRSLQCRVVNRGDANFDGHVVSDEQPQQDTTPVGVLASPLTTIRRELPGRLAGLSLRRQVFVLAMWPLMEQVLNFGVSFVDTALAGRLSVEATNAIGVAAYFGWLIGLVQGAVGTGATAIIARAIGGSHRRIANAALGNALVLGLIAGIAIGVIIFALSPFIAAQVGLTGESARLCVIYLRIMGLAAPFSALLFVGAAALRGAGDTRTPFWVLVIVNIINTATSLFLVAGPAPWGGHGVTGIAVGTLIAWVIGSALILIVLAGGWGGIRLRWIRLRPHRHTMTRLINIGTPNMLERLLAMWMVNFFILKIVGKLGNDAAWGAHIIAIRVESMSFMLGFAFGIAAAALAGQYLGLGDTQRAKQAVVLCWKLASMMMIGLGLVFIFLPGPLCWLLTDEPRLLEMATPLVRLCGFVQVFFATAIVLGEGMRGAGDTKATLWLTALSTYAVRLPLVYLFALTLGYGLYGVWMGLCVELIFRGAIFAARFAQGRWMEIKV